MLNTCPFCGGYPTLGNLLLLQTNAYKMKLLCCATMEISVQCSDVANDEDKAKSHLEKLLVNKWNNRYASSK